MGVACFDEGTCEVLSRLAKAHHLSLVVGAGASVAAQLPGWEELIQRLLTRGRSRKASTVARLLTSTQGYLLAAEAAFPPNATAKNRKKSIATALYGTAGPESLVPSELHQSVALLAAHRDPSRLQIFTTNYDELLEQALRDEQVLCRPRFEAKNPARGQDFPIHHIHGFLGAKQESEDIVLGQSDYSRVAQAHSDWPADELGSSAGKGPVIFVGASLTDPNLLRILDRIKDREVERHVLVLARQGLKAPFELRGDFQKRLKVQWQRYNIDVVLLEDFSDISLFVRELAEADQGSYLPPARKVAKLWSRVNEEFLNRQKIYAAALEEGLGNHLRDLLGDEANLVLWLNDAEGSLVRFAANDRLHRSPGILRRFPDRHDAGWVLSEALAFGVPVVRDLSQARNPEGPGLDHRWKMIAAVPLKPVLGGGGPITIGALSCASVQWTQDAFEALGQTLTAKLAAEWETRLRQAYETGSTNLFP